MSFEHVTCARGRCARTLYFAAGGGGGSERGNFAIRVIRVFASESEPRILVAQRAGTGLERIICVSWISRSSLNNEREAL